MTLIGDIGEFDVIEQLVEALGPQPETMGLGTRLILAAGDDCAAAESFGTTALYSTDTMVNGRHFLTEMPPGDLGWKSLASNISDIAAMGGLPTLALVTVGAPPDLDLTWLLDWYRGMADCAREFGVAIAGGDMVRTGSEFFVTVAMTGEVETGKMITRRGAAAGDSIVVTGRLGESAAGLQLWLANDRPPPALHKAHLRPRPRLFEARAAASAGPVHAMMDLSDGLAGDIHHICQASGVGARIMANQIPLSPDLAAAAKALDQDPLELAISGGEDYELLIFTPPGHSAAILNAVRSLGTEATVIGEATPAASGVHLISPDGRERPLSGGFRHF